MKLLRVVLGLLIIVLAGCSEEDTSPIEKPSVGIENIVTLAGNAENVNVLIFNQNGNDYNYKREINLNIQDTANLEYSTYKFLFYKSAGLNSDKLPAVFTSENLFEDVIFQSRTDLQNDGYVLPVDEIWLPESADLANQSYSINSDRTIRNILTRAVSQVIVHIRKGTYDESNPPTPVELSETPVAMGEIIMDIQSVGEYVTFNGATGNKKTMFINDESLLSEDGDISFIGPFVFPSENGETTVSVTYTPTATSEYPDIEKTVSGRLERNKRLEITFWVSEEEPPVGREFINITVETTDMEGDLSGDEGIWE